MVISSSRVPFSIAETTEGGDDGKLQLSKACVTYSLNVGHSYANKSMEAECHITQCIEFNAKSTNYMNTRPIYRLANIINLWISVLCSLRFESFMLVQSSKYTYTTKISNKRKYKFCVVMIIYF